MEGDGADTSLFGEIVRQVSRDGCAGTIAGEDQFAASVAHILCGAAELLDAGEGILGFDQLAVREQILLEPLLRVFLYRIIHVDGMMVSGESISCIRG